MKIQNNGSNMGGQERGRIELIKII